MWKSCSHGKHGNDLPKNKTIEQSKVNKLRVNLLEEIINLNGDVNKLKKHDVKMREDFNDRNENDVLKLAAIERRKFLTDSILIWSFSVWNKIFTIVQLFTNL